MQTLSFSWVSFQTEVETDSEVEDDPYETRSKCEY